MIVVSNTSPINNLAAIAQLNLLPQMYGKVIIPEAVYEELTKIPVEGTEEVKSSNWIEKRQAKNINLVEELKNKLDPGEAEAIALAIEIKADLLLIDERLGRGIAENLNLDIIGVLGILLEAKKRGLITLIQPLLEQLRNSNFWIKPELYARVLALAGE
jgi:predicted nucleic acid-binding protein